MPDAPKTANNAKKNSVAFIMIHPRLKKFAIPMSVGAQSPINKAKRSPCAGSSGLMKTHVAIETATLTQLAVKQKVESLFSFIDYSFCAMNNKS